MIQRISDVEENIAIMDDTYDANFGEWIRNEENAKIVAHHMKKYIQRYSPPEFIIVLKWVVKDWTLRSIIVLMKGIVIDEVILTLSKTETENLYSYLSNKDTQRSICIVKGVVYTWKPSFIVEFLVSSTRNFLGSERGEFIAKILTCFEDEKRTEIIEGLEGEIDNECFEIVRQVKFVDIKSMRLLSAYEIDS